MCSNSGSSFFVCFLLSALFWASLLFSSPFLPANCKKHTLSPRQTLTPGNIFERGDKAGGGEKRAARAGRGQAGLGRVRPAGPPRGAPCPPGGGRGQAPTRTGASRQQRLPPGFEPDLWGERNRAQRKQRDRSSSEKTGSGVPSPGGCFESGICREGYGVALTSGP